MILIPNNKSKMPTSPAPSSFLMILI